MNKKQAEQVERRSAAIGEARQLASAVKKSIDVMRSDYRIETQLDAMGRLTDSIQYLAGMGEKLAEAVDLLADEVGRESRPCSRCGGSGTLGYNDVSEPTNCHICDGVGTCKAGPS